MEPTDKGHPDPEDTWDSDSQPAASAAGWSGLVQPDEPDAPEDHPFEHPDRERYERRGMLGQGGMGRVVTVLDHRLRREVALKEVAQRAGSTIDAEARLAREAWITAQLEHPGIVPVHDAGRTPDGRLYYTMRLIRGKSLEALLSDAPTLEERLRLLRPFLDACQALAYAHSLGIVHRDIKPANVMIGEFGETQVVDWGLARPADSERGEKWRGQVLPDPDLTNIVRATVAGTPAYMSPEQASGEQASERSDVWGLGAVLHELLTGRPPFTGSDSREILKKLRTRPPEPITDPEAPPELIAIAQRALQRDPDERYEDARALAADVIRYVDGRHVRAYDYTPTDHLRRFLAAWRTPIAVGVVAALAVIAVGITGALQTAAERDRAQSAEAQMGDALKQADDNLALALVQQARIAANAGARPEAEILAAHALTLGPSPEARGVLASFDRPRPILERVQSLDEMPCRDADRHLTADGSRLMCLSHDAVSMWSLSPLKQEWSRPMRAQWGHLNEGRDEVVLTGQDLDERLLFLRMSDGSLLRELSIKATPDQMTFSASGEHAAINRVRLITVGAGEVLSFEFCPDGNPTDLTPIGSDALIWICHDSIMRIGGVGIPLRLIPVDTGPIAASAIKQLTVSDDERWVVISTHRGDLLLVDLTTEEVVHTALISMGTIRDIAISPDNRLIAIAGERGEVRLWHRESGTWLSQLPATQAARLRFTSATRLRVISDDIEDWELPTSMQPDHMRSIGGFTATAYSPDGTMLCGATGNGRLMAWSMATDASQQVLLDTLLTTFQVAKDCDFTADSRHLIGSALSHRGVPVIRTDDWSTVTLLQHSVLNEYPYFRRLGALQGGLIFGLHYGRNGPEVWQISEEGQEDEGGTRDYLRVPGRYFMESETNHSRTAAVLFDRDGLLYRLQLGEPPTIRDVARRPLLTAVDITNDGAHIAAADDRTVEIFAADTDTTLLTLGPTEGRIREVAFSHDDRTIAAGQSGGVVHLWEVESGRLVAVLRGHNELVASIAFSPDGQHMATASWDGTLRLWNLSDLHTPAEALVTRLEDAWQMGLEEALAAEVY